MHNSAFECKSDCSNEDYCVKWDVNEIILISSSLSLFTDEETGCYIGSGVKVKIIRRWSYESRVAVIICRASICKLINTNTKFKN